LAEERQKRKRFLSDERTFLTLRRQILTFRIEGFQTLAPFSFLIVKNASFGATPERAYTTLAQASLAPTPQEESGAFRPGSTFIVDKSRKALKVDDCG